jgi:hypothetical protein
MFTSHCTCQVVEKGEFGGVVVAMFLWHHEAEDYAARMRAIFPSIEYIIEEVC